MAGLFELFISHSDILNIPTTAHGQRPNHHLTAQLQARSVHLSLWFNLWNWQDCLNILCWKLKWYPQHSSHCSRWRSQSPSALHNFRPDQLFCFISLIKISDLELGNITWIFYSSTLTPQLEAQVLHMSFYRAHFVTGWGWGSTSNRTQMKILHEITNYPIYLNKPSWAPNLWLTGPVNQKLQGLKPKTSSTLIWF